MGQKQSMSEYSNRREEKFGLSKKEDIKRILSTQSDAVFLDVRSEVEVGAQSLEGVDQQVLYVPCTMSDASMLESVATEILPDKNGKKGAC